MRVDRLSRILSIAALVVALAALFVAGQALAAQRDQQRRLEALGDLMRRSAASGRTVMDMGAPGGGLPELDRGE